MGCLPSSLKKGMQVSEKRDQVPQLKLESRLGIALLVAILARLLWLLTTYDYQDDAYLRALNMMTLVYHPIWPPGYFYLAKPFYVLFGHSYWVLRGMSFVTGVGSVAFLYWLAKEISGKERTAFLAALFVAILPASVSHSVQSMAEMPFVFFMVVCLYALIKGRILWSAGLLGLATMIRYEAWPFVLVIPLYLLARSALIKQGPPAWSKRPVKDAFSFLAVSSFLPIVYVVTNRLTIGYYVWSLTPENPNFSRSTNIAVWRSDVSLTHFAGRVVSLFANGFTNVTSVFEPVIGRMEFYLGILNPVRLCFLGYLLLLLVTCTAILGIVHGLRRRYRGFLLLLLALTLSLGFLLLSLLRGAVSPYTRFTFWSQTLITLLSAIGIESLIARHSTKLVGYGLATVVILGLLAISLSSRYSGPKAIAEVAAHLADLMGTSTPAERLQRVVGLTGPEKQTEQVLRVAGPWAQHLQLLMHLTSDREAVIIDGSCEPLDTRRSLMIQALADLSYNQLCRVSSEDAEGTIIAGPLVVVLFKDSVERQEEGRSTRLRERLSMEDYSITFTSGPFEIWTVRSDE